MNSKNPFRHLTRFEWCFWIACMAVIAVASFLSHGSPLSIAASLIGVTALIFIAKGMVLGQFLIVIFATLYGIVSIQNRLYGEMITYLFMSAPMAVFSILSWIRHPFKESHEVEVRRMTKKDFGVMLALAALVTTVFFFILRQLGAASLPVSTLSMATSFMAVFMTWKRSPYYALGYGLNDVVLIVLWILATVRNPDNFPMILCFSVFFFQDFYGFISWRRMEKRQKAAK